MIRSMLIINPISGTRSKRELETLVTDMLPDREITTVHTRRSGSATRLARRAVREGFDEVLAAGGDGTINETACGLRDTGIPLGILPCGSGNGLARHLGIPVDIEGALEVIRDGHRVQADYAMAAKRPFFCTLGMGFDAAVSEAFARQPRRGRMSYLRSTLSTFLSYRPARYTIRANGKVLTDDAFLVAVCNASQYGNNAYIAPHACINDGLLDVMVVHPGTRISTALVGLDLISGNIDSNMLIHSFRTNSLTIERHSPNTPLHLDGEPVDNLPATLDISIRPGGLTIYAPEVIPEVTPFVSPLRAMVRDSLITLRHIVSPR